MGLFRNITELLPHIEFACTVNGKELTAWVTHKENDGVQTRYLVSFSDGHQDLYIPGDELVQEDFGCTRHLDAYEEAVYDDLCVIPRMTKGNRYRVIGGVEEGGESFRVWVREGRGFYPTFYKGQYQFTLCKSSGRWTVNTRRKKGYVVNLSLVRLVSDYLDLHNVF